MNSPNNNTIRCWSCPLYRHSVHQIVRLAYIKRWALEHSMAEGWISHPSLSLLWFSKTFFFYFRQMKRICFPLWPRWCVSLCGPENLFPFVAQRTCFAVDLIQHKKKTIQRWIRYGHWRVFKSADIKAVISIKKMHVKLFTPNIQA